MGGDHPCNSVTQEAEAGEWLRILEASLGCIMRPFPHPSKGVGKEPGLGITCCNPRALDGGKSVSSSMTQQAQGTKGNEETDVDGVERG